MWGIAMRGNIPDMTLHVHYLMLFPQIIRLRKPNMPFIFISHVNFWDQSTKTISTFLISLFILKWEVPIPATIFKGFFLIFLSVYMRVRVYVCVCVCICACTCACVYLHMCRMPCLFLLFTIFLSTYTVSLFHFLFFHLSLFSFMNVCVPANDGENGMPKKL